MGDPCGADEGGSRPPHSVVGARTGDPESFARSRRTRVFEYGQRAIPKALQRVEPGITSHGFRSTFRDGVAEQTNFPSEVAEMALVHAVGDKVEAAYRRSDLCEKRR
jgi:integrase